MNEHSPDETKLPGITVPTEEPRIGGLGLASLSVGIIGLWPWFGVLGIILGPLGLLLARAELRRISEGLSSKRGNGIAVAGLVLGIVQTVIGALWLIFGVIAIIMTAIRST